MSRDGQKLAPCHCEMKLYCTLYVQLLLAAAVTVMSAGQSSGISFTLNSELL